MSKRRKGSDSSQGGLTRRSFLKGVGVAAGGTSIFTSGLLTHAADAATPNTVGPDATQIVLNINGGRRQVSVEPRIARPWPMSSATNWG